MVDPVSLIRTSPLDGLTLPGHYGLEGETGIQISEVRNLQLSAICSWPRNLSQLESEITRQTGLGKLPVPCQTLSNDVHTLMRVEPLKWWLLGPPVDVDSSLASVVDLSHAYCCLSLRGPSVTDLLSRHLALDLRDAERFVASTVMHHTGVTLQVETDDHYLYLPRGFSRSLYEILFESALQFGIEVR